MAYLNSFTFPLTGDVAVDVSTQGSVWALTPSRTMYWALADGFLGEFWLDPAFSVDRIDAALNVVEAFIDVNFEYAGYYTTPIVAGSFGADLVYSLDGWNAITPPGTWAIGHFPNYNFYPLGYSSGYSTQAGDIFLNANESSTFQTNFLPGSAGFFLILHETFHALGLKHVFDSGGSGRPTLANLGIAELDKDWISVMSYDDDFPLQNNFWDPATPMLLDVVALQYLYGANQSTNAGNTRHVLTEKAGYETIWDAGGRDLVDLSQLVEGWSVLLPNESVSDLVNLPYGLALPLSEVGDASPRHFFWLTGMIEDARGSDHGDVLIGSWVGNTLSGGKGDDLLEGWGGDDTIDGGEGTDIATMDAAQRHFTLEIRADGAALIDRRDGGLGRDALTSVERLDFSEELPVFRGEPMRLDLFDEAAAIASDTFAQITELYIAYFNRAPDALGLSYWASESARGFSIEQMAASFFVQDETQAAYPNPSDTEGFVTAVYNNVLGRAPDEEGFNYWVGDLNNNPAITPPIFILAIINGAKAASGSAADVAYLGTKSDIGIYFAVEKGMSDLDNSRAVMDLYDGSSGSTASAIQEIDRLYSSAVDPENGEFLMPVVGVVDSPFA